MDLKESFLIEKRNALNEIRSNNLTLQELRFFSIYLAKINARDISTRVVRFRLADFQRIMNIARLNIAQLRDTIDGLLSKIVGVPLGSGFKRFQLFRMGVFSQDEEGNWYVEIDANDEALPLMFEFKERYFTYKLWNALRLKSVNQLRMYEILKQYEGVGERILSVGELKELLGLEQKDYPRFNTFRESVIDVCQEALEENTDIKFTYEPTKRGARGKINTLRFTISKNKDYKDQVLLDEFIDQQDMSDDFYDDDEIAADADPVDDYFGENIYPMIQIACGGEFSRDEAMVLYDLTIQICPPESGIKPDAYVREICFQYIKRKYDELKIRLKRKDLPPVKSHFSYLKKTMEAELLK